MWRFLVGLFAIVGVISVLLFAGTAYVAYAVISGLGDRPEAPERIVLSVDLREGVRDGRPSDGLAEALGRRRASLRDAINAIDAAAEDDRVAMLVTEFAGTTLDLASAQELRDAVARFRASGRPALAFADTFGEFGPADVALYLAAGYDEIWMRPVGTVGLAGLSADVPFAAAALASIGIEPQVFQRGRYKTFPNTFTEDGLTAAHREMMESLIGDLFDQIVTGIAEGRGLEPAALAAAIDDGPFLADEALALGLIDQLDGRRAFDEAVDDRSGEAERLDPMAYLAIAPEVEGTGEVGLVYAVGAILMDDGDGIPGLDTRVADARTTAQAIADAVDAGVDAIVLRVNSPGGSAVASAVIAEAIRNARADGVPVIASMGQTAASGGYWVAAAADAIVAQPGTQTASIGVFAGTLATGGLWDNLGITWEGVSEGENAGIWSPIRPYSRAEAARVRAVVDRIYDDFLDHVATARGLDRSAVEAVAEGRVWTGRQALEHGLVDDLGGLDTALATARDRIGVADGAPLTVRLFPEPRSPFDDLAQLLDGGVPVHSGTAERLLALPGARDTLEMLLREPGDLVVRTPGALLAD